MDMDLGKLHDKGKLQDFDKTQLYTQMMSLAGLYLPKEEKYIREFITNSEATGIDVKKEAFIYANNDYMGMIVPLKDRKKFDDYLKRNKSPENKEEPKKIDRFLGINKDNTLIAWDDNVIYILQGLNAQSPQQVETDFKSYINLAKDASVTSHPYYSKLMSGKKDVSVMMDMEKMMKLVTDKMASQAPEVENQVNPVTLAKMFKDSYVNLFVDLADDEIITTFDGRISDELNSIFNPEKLNRSGVSDKLLKLFPKNSFEVYAQSFDPNEAAKSFKAFNDKYIQSNEGLIRNDSVKTLFKTIEKFLKYSDKLDGEMLSVITDISNNDYGMINTPYKMPFSPGSIIALGTKDNSILESLMKENEIKLNKVGNYYELNETEGKKFYIANLNNVLMISSDPSAFAVLEKGGCTDNLTSSPYAAQLKKGNFGYVNLDFNTWPDGLRSMIYADGSPKPIIEKLNIFDAITFESDKKGLSGKATLKFKNKNQNAFYTLIQTVENLVKAAMGA